VLTNYEKIERIGSQNAKEIHASKSVLLAAPLFGRKPRLKRSWEMKGSFLFQKVEFRKTLNWPDDLFRLTF
jgi:hypothetical protein